MANLFWWLNLPRLRFPDSSLLTRGSANGSTARLAAHVFQYAAHTEAHINFKRLCGRSSHVVYQDRVKLFQLKKQLLEQFQRLLMSLSYPSANSWILKPSLHATLTCPQLHRKIPRLCWSCSSKITSSFSSNKNPGLGKVTGRHRWWLTSAWFSWVRYDWIDMLLWW